MLRKASVEDVGAINDLIQTYGYVNIDHNWINDRDISVVYLDKGKIVGFLWAGIMNNATLAYLDFLVVDKAYEKKDVSRRLFEEVTKELKLRGIKLVLAGVFKDEYYFRARNIARSNGMKQLPGNVTYFVGDVNFMYERIR